MTPSTGSNSPNLGEEFLDKILIIPSQKDLTNWLALVPATLLKMCSFFFFYTKKDLDGILRGVFPLKPHLIISHSIERVLEGFLETQQLRRGGEIMVMDQDNGWN